MKMKICSRFLNGCIVLTQKTWRGCLGRRVYYRLLADEVVRMRQSHYNQAATKIQSAWRGFRTRKYRFNFYARKVYLESLKQVGNHVREQLMAYEQNQRDQIKVVKEANEEDRIWAWAKAHHFCVSTFCQPGVYNGPRKRRSNSTEQLLLAVRSDLARESIPKRQQKTKPRQSIDPKETTNITHVSVAQSTDQALPPLVDQDRGPKGPFRRPSEVRRWRHKPLELSLRASTDFQSLNKARGLLRDHEWLNRVHDEPFHAGRVSTPRYQKLLLSTSDFGALPYGTKHFRDWEDLNVHYGKLNLLENPSEEMEDESTVDCLKKRFENVLPPIPLFDRWQKEYVRGYVDK